MKIINLDSKYELTKAQISFAESVIICGDGRRMMGTIPFQVDNVPIFLVSPATQEEFSSVDDWREEDEVESNENEDWREEDEVESNKNKDWKKDEIFDVTELGVESPIERDLLGFYSPSLRILGKEIPAIGLCVEKIMNNVKNDEELIILIAKVIAHEFAHAMMSPHKGEDYGPRDEFYLWMEESIANFHTLNCFHNFEDKSYWYKRYYRRGYQFATTLNPTPFSNSISPLEYVKTFISTQPKCYRLGLDLFENSHPLLYEWRDRKFYFAIKRTEPKKRRAKAAWLNYVKKNVGNTDSEKLDKLFEALF